MLWSFWSAEAFAVARTSIATNIAHDKAVYIAAMFIIKPLIAIMIFSKIVAWFAF